MKISVLIKRLEEIKKDCGDIDVDIKIGFFDGAYGEYNSEIEAEISDINLQKGRIILSGNE